jgi:hypothetical protein
MDLGGNKREKKTKGEIDQGRKLERTWWPAIWDKRGIPVP